MRHYKSTDACSKYRLGDLVAYSNDTGEGVVISMRIDHDMKDDRASNLRIALMELLTGKTTEFLANSTMCDGARILKNIPNFSKENNPEYFI